MKSAIATFRGTVGLVVLAFLISSCAATRSTLDLTVPRVEAPTGQTSVKLIEVNDRRSFEANPRTPSVPSLQNAAEINDPAIRSRALARKRGGFGMAMADILLPEGRTVEQLVREAVTTAFRDRGYLVVDDTSPVNAKALPLSVDIRQFWSWFTPGFWAISIEFEGIVILKSEALLINPEETVRGYALARSMAATDGEWQRTMQQGIGDLIDKMKARIRRPEEVKSSAQ